MPDIVKLMRIDIEDISKIMGVDKNSLSKFMGLDISSSSDEFSPPGLLIWEDGRVELANSGGGDPTSLYSWLNGRSNMIHRES